MAVTIYDLKPRFQSLLRPLVSKVASAGVSANQVTILACLISLGVGGFVAYSAAAPAFGRWPFLLLPIWFLLRMALNAVDGMLAREFGWQSPLGAYLNELTDVVSDAALYLPFAFVAPFGPYSVGVVIFMASVSEMAGALGPMAGTARRYDGPMGKSDRAFVFGALGLYVALGGQLASAAFWLMPAIALLIGLNIYHRVRRGAASADASKGSSRRGARST